MTRMQEHVRGERFPGDGRYSAKLGPEFYRGSRPTTKADKNNEGEIFLVRGAGISNKGDEEAHSYL